MLPGIASALIVIGLGSLGADRSGNLLDRVVAYADCMIAKGQDTYGTQHSPLFAEALDRFGFLILFAFMFLLRPVLGWLMQPAWWGFNQLLNLAVPFAVGDGWNIFQS